MEIINEVPASPKKLIFRGSGSELFGVLLLNWILTMITFGLYYPWARARTFSFLYGNTEMEDSRFAFHGTGREMFFGFIKAIVLFVILYGFFIWAATSGPMMTLIGMLVFYIGLMVLVPVAIHGGLRYRLAKTSWRNIHFGYRGDRGELVKMFIPGTILTAITFGIYASWFSTTLRTYIIGNIRFGSLRFKYTGTGGELFWINFKGFVLGFLTLGIYLFWYMKNWTSYYLNHLEVEQDGNSYPVRAHISAGDYIGFSLVNFILLMITFGLATPWIMVRTFNFFFHRIELPAEIRLDQVQQTESDYSDATGEDIIDMMDIGII